MSSAANVHWSDLSPTARSVILALGCVQVSLAVAAWVDLARRPGEQVRGSKWVWAPVIGIDFVGPIGYFVKGVRRDR